MPEDYSWTDNFFKKMTDLESPRKNNDCYFYYYSKCAKGDSCTFRHEPSALGCETVCSFWQAGKCLNAHCNFRHMELRKNRKAIQCYWESQPGGCLKPHCPFLHQSARPSTGNESLESKTDSGTESADNTLNDKLTISSDKTFKNTPVDSLVVNFEEESDNESAPINSPVKSSQRVVKVKTLEQIKLERIQAESAAFYSYPDATNFTPQQSAGNADDLRQRILDRMHKTVPLATRLDFGKKRPLDCVLQDPLRQFKKARNTDLSEIKIKTLAEIRAEKAQHQPSELVSDCSVTSTCPEYIVQEEPKPKTKVKLQRKFISRVENQEEEEADEPMAEETEPPKVESAVEVKETMEQLLLEGDDEDMPIVPSTAKDETKSEAKILDEVLLLQDDDDASNVSLKEEDELLNDIDDLLDD